MKLPSTPGGQRIPETAGKKGNVSHSTCQIGCEVKWFYVPWNLVNHMPGDGATSKATKRPFVEAFAEAISDGVWCQEWVSSPIKVQWF